MNVPVFIDISLDEQAEELKGYFKSQVCLYLKKYLKEFRRAKISDLIKSHFSGPR